MSTSPTPPATIDELRTQARDLYCRSDNVPLSRDDRASIDRVGELRGQADALMRQAVELTVADLATAAVVHIAETRATWWRVFGGRHDGLWTNDDGPTVPSGGRLKNAAWLAQQGAVIVEERI